MTEHPAVAYLRNGLARAEALAQAATPGPWFAHTHDWNDHEFAADIGTSPTPGPDQAANVVGHGWESGGVVEQHDADFIAANSPDTVLRRVVKARELLTEHAGTWASGEPEYDYHHETAIGATGRTRYIEVASDEPIDPYMCTTCQQPGYPCRTVLLLAEAWGWEA
jgi:hypothetical protein